jgi:hypothetical protein
MLAEAGDEGVRALKQLVEAVEGAVRDKGWVGLDWEETEET